MEGVGCKQKAPPTGKLGDEMTKDSSSNVSCRQSFEAQASKVGASDRNITPTWILPI